MSLSKDYIIEEAFIFVRVLLACMARQPLFNCLTILGELLNCRKTKQVAFLVKLLYKFNLVVACEGRIGYCDDFSTSSGVGQKVKQSSSPSVANYHIVLVVDVLNPLTESQVRTDSRNDLSAKSERHTSDRSDRSENEEGKLKKAASGSPQTKYIL